MLVELLKKTIEMGDNALEIEYKDGKEWVTALQDQEGFGVGFGIADVPSDSKQSEQLLKEMEDLKRKKQITVDGVKYKLVFSKYESFGEWTYKITIKKVREARSK